MTDRVLIPVFAVLLMVLAHRVLFTTEALTNAAAPQPLLYLYPPGKAAGAVTTSVSFTTGPRAFDCTETPGAGCLGTLQVTLYDVPGAAFVDPKTVLASGAALVVGQTLTAGTAALVMGTDGNLVLFDGGAPVWSTNTSGGTNRATLRPDGNFVVTNDAGASLWASGTDFGALAITPGAGYTLTLSPAPPGGTANLTLTNQMGATVWTAIQSHQDLLEQVT